MKLNFTKMHGLGNDYIYFNCFNQTIENPEELSIKLSNRNFGIGGDGIILVCPSDVADCKMRMFNLDGSEGKMCGNGIRCVGKFLYDYNIVDNQKEEVLVETLSGIKKLKVFKEDEVVRSLTVNMGKPELEAERIPVLLKKSKIVDEKIIVEGEQYSITCVSMGNPHCVIFTENIDEIDLEKIGPEFENNKIFPERINTEFVEVIDKSVLKMRVWERGSGETLACGTGACAVAVAAVEKGICNKNDDIQIKLKGGDLKIKYTNDEVFMTGEATKVFEGIIEI